MTLKLYFPHLTLYILTWTLKMSLFLCHIAELSEEFVEQITHKPIGSSRHSAERPEIHSGFEAFLSKLNAFGLGRIKQAI